MALKIATREINGQQCVDPDTMKLLLDFAGHRNICDQCTDACNRNTGFYCTTGALIFAELLELPDVQYIDDKA